MDTSGTVESRIAMLGSANMDIVLGVDRIPRPGETLLANSAANYPGGKGLNQAVAAARSGVPTVFLGALGDDDHGRALARVMAETGIDSSLVRQVADPTGQALIVVDANAENAIVVVAGANARMTTLAARERTAIENATVLLMQLEIPIGAVVSAATIARRAGRMVILNAAPAQELPEGLLGSLDCLIVNEHEVCVISGLEDVGEASERLAARVDRLVVTIGAAGSVLFEGGSELARVPALRVAAVDTTGAGDTFCGALAARLAEGSGLVDAARFATAAAAISVQTLGAVPSIPTREQVEAVLSA